MQTDQRLWQLLDGELSEAEAARMRAEAARDPAIQARLDALCMMKEGVLGGTPPVPPDFAQRVEALAARRAFAPPLDLAEMRRFLRRALVAAAILGAVGLAFLAIEVGPRLFGPAPLQAQDPLLGGR